jgi:hypothetical protein
MKRRFWRLLLATTAALGLSAFPMLALLASADINGDCSATINGVDVRGRSSTSAGDAIDVKEHTAVPVTMSSANEISRLKVQLEFAGFRWTVHDEPTSGTSWESSVAVDDYAKYGVGLYKVIGVSDGPAGSCSGSALVNVSGNPLTTVAGAAAAGATALGAAGLAVAGATSALEGRSSTRSIEEWVTDELERTAHAEDQEQREPELPQFLPEPLRLCCFFAALPALLLTGMAMATGGGLPASAKPAARLRRVGWRPRISAMAIIAGLLLGAGIVVLLQQYAVLYPTRAVAIGGLVAGLILGLVIPSLLRVFAVRRINRAIARAEQRLSQAPAQQPPAPPEAQG